ncbi:MAG TPA: GMC family oxidoreductase [Pyrinomonadaceae bacterium]|jgi:cholesterol oxidase
MPRLANSIDDIKNHYQAVVIGSGYGGSIAASRLARAGVKVCVLERGREFQPGEYPNTRRQLAKETQLDLPGRHIGSQTALIDLRFNDDINVFVGCGLGGTSLINGGVSLRVEPRVFDDERWPIEIRDEARSSRGESDEEGWEFRGLSKYYELAETMLRPSRYPEHYPRLAKMAALEKAAQQMKLPFNPVPINVNFEEFPGGLNHVGVSQIPCIGCGDCASGCNYGAKNTLIVNYLPDARNHGAELFTQASVQYLERRGDQWVVHGQKLGSEAKGSTPQEFTVTADIVILGAGTMGSNEILLRSREKGLSLSDALGSSFSGNGDVVGFSYNTEQVINGIGFGNRNPKGREPVGPFASGIIDARRQHDFLVIEGSLPGAMSAVLPFVLATADELVGVEPETGIIESIKRKIRILLSLFSAYTGATGRTQTYLVVNQDDSGGRMFLQDNRLRVSWPTVGQAEFIERSRDILKEATRVLGGTFLTTVKWNKWTAQSLLTGHPTGGCAMADEAGGGVVNHKGQVYKGKMGTEVHKGLYVMDAAVLSRSIGVNPLLTISALAERSCHHMAQDYGWTIDYRLPRAEGR